MANNISEQTEPLPPENDVPSILRVWFVIHFALDIAFALPLFIAPNRVLELFGWVTVDTIATRLAAAALFGIGVESLLGRNAGRESFNGMLRLKILWSGFATIGLVWSVIEADLKYLVVGWLLVAIFAAFHLLWWYWFLRLRRD